MTLPDTIDVHPATAVHMRRIYNNLRESDAKEIRAAGYDVEEAMLKSLQASWAAWTLRYRGVPVAMLGVAQDPEETNTGIPWFLGAKEMDNPVVRRYVAKVSQRYLKTLLAYFPKLRNWVAEDNKASIRWLRWLGFRIGKPELKGCDETRFCQIEYEVKK